MGSFAPATPYAAVLAALERELRPTPSPGFRGRALLLQALVAAYVTLALVYLAFLAFTDRRGTQRSPRLFKSVQVPTGPLFALDTRFLLPCTTIAVGILSIGNIAVISSPDVDAGTGAQFGLRAFRGLLLFVQGWVVTWGALQSFWAASPGKSARLPRAQSANLLFIGVGCCGIFTGFAAGISTVVTGQRVNECFAWIRSALERFEQTNPTGSVAMLLGVAPGVNALREAAQSVRATMLATYGVLGVMVLAVLCVCIYGVQLLVIREPVAWPVQPPSPPTSAASSAASSNASSAEKSEFIEDLSAVEDGRLNDGFGEARDDLAVTCLVVGLLSAVMACSLAFSISLTVQERLFGDSSYAAELAYLVFGYCYAVVQLIAFTFLLHDLFTDLAAPQLPLTPGAVPPTRARVSPSSRVMRLVRAVGARVQKWRSRRVK